MKKTAPLVRPLEINVYIEMDVRIGTAFAANLQLESLLFPHTAPAFGPKVRWVLMRGVMKRILSSRKGDGASPRHHEALNLCGGEGGEGQFY